MKKIALLGMCMFGFLFGGCKASEFVGKWTIQKFEVEGVVQQLAVSEINLEKKGGSTFEAHGNSGINSFFGKVKISGNKIVVDDKMASTKMAGDPAAMEFEDNFLICLTGADKVEIINENGLELLKISNSKKNMALYFKK